MTSISISTLKNRLGDGPWLVYVYLYARQFQGNTSTVTIQLTEIQSAFSNRLNTCKPNLYRWLKRLKSAKLLHLVPTPSLSKKERGYGVFTVTPVLLHQDLVWVPEDVAEALHTLTSTPITHNYDPPSPPQNNRKKTKHWETSDRCGNNRTTSRTLKRSLGAGPWALYRYLVGLRLGSKCQSTRTIYIHVSHIVEKSKFRHSVSNVTQRNVYRWLHTLKDAQLIQEVTPSSELAEKYKNIHNAIYGWYQVYGRKTESIWLVPADTITWLNNKALHGGYRPGAFGQKDEHIDEPDFVFPDVGHPHAIPTSP